MKPPSFEYAVARSVEEAVSLLEQSDGEGKVLAGGQSLVPLLNMRLARPSILIDLGRLADLDYVREEDGVLAIGGMTRQCAIERSALVAERQPLFHGATHFIGHPSIRNRGTVGGSIAHADPAAVYPAATVALGATFRVRGPAGERTIGAEDFFVGPLTSALEPAEILTEVRLPALAPRTGWSFQELARRHGDFAMAGAAATVTLDGSGRCAEARVVAFGVGPTPLRVREAEAALAGERPEGSVLDRAAQAASAAAVEAPSDVHASAEYRQHLAGVLVRRALTEAAVRAASA